MSLSNLRNFRNNWRNFIKHWRSISLSKKNPNISKSELVLFKPKMKKLDLNHKLKLSGKRLYPTKSVKHLGVKIDEKLLWIHLINATVVKLHRANAMLFK